MPTSSSPSLQRRKRKFAFVSSAATFAATALVASSLAMLPAHADNSDIVINEVFSANNGVATDPDSLQYDWVELKNTGSAAVNVSGWRIYDEDKSSTKNFTIGASDKASGDTTIPAGGYLVLYLVDDPGLGKGDSVELTTGAGSGGAFDSALQVGATVTWPAKTHADPSWARTSSGTYAMSKVATPGAANVFDDGVEPSASESASASASASPSVTPMGLEAWPGLDSVATVDSSGEFGAKGSDGKHTDGNLSGLVYEPATSTSAAVLWGADNDLNPTLGETGDKGPGSINKFVQVDGKWQQDATDGWSWITAGLRKGGKQLRYEDGTGGVDSEGITLANNSSKQGVFIASERSNLDKNVSRPSILRYDVTKTASDTNGDGAQDLSATNEWNLKPIIESTGVTLGSADSNLGLEGAAFVPDSYLTAHGFRNSDGSIYAPSTTPHFGGLFFAALEKNGHMYAVSLDEDSDDLSLVKDIAIPAEAQAAGYTVIQDLYFDTDTGTLMAQCDNSCGAAEPDGTAKLATYSINADGDFTLNHLYESPAGVANLNTEGFAIAPLSTATTLPSGAANTLYRQVFWSDDGVTDGYSLRTGYMAAGTVSVSPSASSSPSTPSDTSASAPAAGSTDTTTGSSSTAATPAAGDSDVAATNADSDDLASTGLSLAGLGAALILLISGATVLILSRRSRR